MKKKRSNYYTPQWNFSNKKRKKKKQKGSLKRFLLLLLLLLLCGAGSALYLLLRPAGIASKDAYIYITDTTSLERIFEQVEKGLVIRNPRIFRHVARLSHIEEGIRPGKYKLSPSQNMLQIISEIKYGEQTPVRVQLKNARTQQELILALTENLQITPTELSERLEDPTFCATMGFDTITIRAIFTPSISSSTIDKERALYWNTSADSLIAYFKKRYDAFWTPERKKKAQQEGFTPIEIITIASIVQEESNKEEEHPIIAGLYINRLRKGIKLQADPTARYAVGDFTVKRIGKTHIRFDSPYNTYRVEGLPPGPICYPRESTIESVLNYTKHNYIFMCAKADFSGFHAFASTFEEHLKNARLYQKELDRKNIR